MREAGFGDEPEAERGGEEAPRGTGPADVGADAIERPAMERPGISIDEQGSDEFPWSTNPEQSPAEGLVDAS